MIDNVAQRKLGRIGITVPAVGVGCWAIGGPADNLGMPMGWSTADDSASAAGLRKAYELGARLFDTADVYGLGRSERLLGGLISEVPRGGLTLTSKVGYFAGTAEHGYHPGHMTRQLHQSLDNLRTDYLDIYFLHHPDFGPDDQWLEGAVEAMTSFRSQGLIRAVGMRGPHRYAPDRLHPTADKADKAARFRRIFDLVKPEILAVRDNLLTPASRLDGILELAADHGCGILFNKPLSQGLLTAATATGRERTFGPGDHRSRKRWFTPEPVAVIGKAIRDLQQVIGDEPTYLTAVALWACLTRFDNAAVLAGFTNPDQVEQNLAALRIRPDDAHIAAARTIMSGVQRQLDDTGEVFVDEHR
ncbi:aldo/keto reductase [Catellatospora methionotrophica]|uniref:aldo/keto reductase n=1 Tax=Catellatospora methionotrophica TaxID=121620 RepID=UPI003403DB6C